ncbi:hypothetical protein [Microbulbifer variabilis]|uniref:hypothetical protein n=1 Tax=Microbulbifer variabilis TaxID=266805 RepID=UPI00035F6203|nr:hypothetical protein [Microbulbifer variabilis]
MKDSNDTKRFLKGVLIGGPLAIVTLGALIAVIVTIASPPINLLNLAMSIVTLVAAGMATTWATGFWGRWGMVLFFILAPVLVTLDFSINPLFPTGVIVVASLFYGAKYVLRSNA